MKYTALKSISRVEFEQLANGRWLIHNYTFLTARKNWWYNGTREVTATEGQEMLERLERKGFAIARA